MAQPLKASRLSQNLDESHAGYLICKNVPIARAGELIYGEGETPVSSIDGVTVINRSIEDLADPGVISSFEMQPITLDHPDDFVNPESWKEFSIGTIFNVRRGQGDDDDKLVADLMINDAEAIKAIKDGILRQVSCGYLAKFEETGPGRGIQTEFEGNHVAILKYGRCGAGCAIRDAANDAIGEMKTKKYAVIDRLPDDIGLNMSIKDIFKTGKGAPQSDKKVETNDEMSLEDFMEKLNSLAEMVATHGERLSVVESNMMTADADPNNEKDPEDGTVNDECSGTKKEDKTSDADPFSKMSIMLEKILNAVVKTNDSEADKPEKKEEVYVSDAITKSRAEILAPGISDSKDIKEQALKKAYETTDGKEVIDTILSGQPFDSADKEMLFSSSSELLKVIRKGVEHSYAPSNDSQEKRKGLVSDKEFNANCKEVWSKFSK